MNDDQPDGKSALYILLSAILGLLVGFFVGYVL